MPPRHRSFGACAAAKPWAKLAEAKDRWFWIQEIEANEGSRK
jgi:hypothetical protein